MFIYQRVNPHEIPVLLHFLPLQRLPFFLRQLPVQLLPGLLAQRSPIAQDLCSEVVLRRTSDVAPAVVLNQLQEGLNEVLQADATGGNLRPVALITPISLGFIVSRNEGY